MVTIAANPRVARLFGAVLLVLALGLLASAQARADPVLAAAGDIACGQTTFSDANDCQQSATAMEISAANPAAVAALGDNQYENPVGGNPATPPDFSTGFAHSWGAFKSLISPVPGNHEYNADSTATSYFNYFGTAAGDPTKGYYSYDLAGWHMIALNSNCSNATTPSCSNTHAGVVTAAEASWLQADLAAHPGVCTLAYWHHPQFTNGDSTPGTGDRSPAPGVTPLWTALYAAHADVVLNGHNHAYERFDPQDPSGTVTTDGIREFVVGTGGFNLTRPSPPVVPHEEVYDSNHFGVLFVTLHPTGYDWSFKGIDGVVHDSGTAPCHVAAPITSPADGVYSRSHDLTLSGTAEAGRPVTVFENGSAVASTSSDANGNWSTALSGLPDGTHTFTARATDVASAPGPGTNQVRVTVDTVAPPAPIITSPGEGSTIRSSSFTLTGSAEPSSLVTVTDVKGGQGMTAASPAGAWSLPLSGVPDGQHRYSAVATDAAGNTGPSSSPVNATVNSLTLSTVSMTHSRFVVVGSYHRGPKGTAFRLQLSEPAVVHVSIIGPRAGRRSGRSCVAPTRRLRHRRSCVRNVVVTTLTITGHAGSNAAKFSGRVHGRPLARGRYQGIIQAAGAGGGSGAQTVRFTILG